MRRKVATLQSGVACQSVAEAARFIVDRGVFAEGAPVLVRFIAQIASRFGVVVTQKLAAQAVPVIGALGGAAVNYAFIDHFQEIARAHFVVRNSNGAMAKIPSAPSMNGFRAKRQLPPKSSARSLSCLAVWPPEVAESSISYNA